MDESQLSGASDSLLPEVTGIVGDDLGDRSIESGDDVEQVPTLSDKMLEDAILSPTDSLVVSETLESIEDSAGEMEIQKSNGSATEAVVSRCFFFNFFISCDLLM